jgi:NADP-dependent 3-hydroxy acid dehydrogenase YdfG
MSKVTPYEVDVRDRQAMAAAIADFAARGSGRLDAVFANAGVLFMGEHMAIEPEKKALMIEVNTRGVLNTIDPAFPFLRDTPKAHIVAMVSASAEYGTAEHAVYSATKFFVRGLTEALDIEYAPFDIRVAGIYVGYVNTPMVRDAEVKSAALARLGVNVAPEQVAEGVWRAVHGGRSHWRLGRDARLLHWLSRILGGWSGVLQRRARRG